MKLRTIKEIKDLKGKRVLLRVNFNVPLLNGKVADDSRIKAALPTIEYLLARGAKIILVSHLGRPKGVDKKYSLAPVAKRLEKLLGRKIKLVERKEVGGNIVMLENVRFNLGEEKNDSKFAKELAGLADIYVNDAFPDSHRAHASIVGVTKYLPSYAGLRLEQEVSVLSALLKKPKKPFVALIGGAKIFDKIGAIKNLSEKAGKILLGGALANNFLKAMGYEVGASLVEVEGVKLAKSLLKNKKIILPLDVVVGMKDGKKAMVVDIARLSSREVQIIKQSSSLLHKILRFARGSNLNVICKKPLAILDIGPKTILEYAKQLKKAKTLIWNGPMGLYEVKQFSHGTMALGRLFASRSKGLAYGVAGGGETIDALDKTGLAEYVDWISMGGGAMLEFLEGKNLPGIKVLMK